MPRERSVDIDDIYDFNIVKLYMKKMKNYLNNFSLKKKQKSSSYRRMWVDR